MQHITINSSPMEVLPFLSEDTIMLLYTAKNVKDGYLYSYSKILQTKPNTYTVTKLKDYLRDEKIPIQNFENRLTSIMDLYPKLTELQVFFSYYQIQPQSVQETLSKPKIFKTIKTTKLKQKYDVWLKSLKSDEQTMVASAKKTLEWYSEIKNYLPKSLPSFATELQGLKYHMPTVATSDIREVFHKIKIIPQLPFVVLKLSGSTTSHIHPSLQLDSEWIDVVEKAEKDGIIFYVCHEAIPLNSSSFSKGFCDLQGNITINVKSTGGGGFANVEKFFRFSMKAFEKNIRQSGSGMIKGTFEVSSTVKFNKLVFCDMLDCDDTFRHFVFVSDYQHFDRNTQNSLTSFTKERLMFYFGLFHNYNKKKCISAIATASGNAYKVRVSKAKNMGDVREFMAVFSALTKVYDANFSKVKALYEGYGIPEKFIVKFQKVKEKVVKTNLKTHGRLLALQKYDPIFSVNGSYAKACESKRQPYIVEKKDYEKKKAELSKRYGTNDLDEYLVKWTLPESGEEVYVGCAPNGDRNFPRLLPASGAPCCYSPKKTKVGTGKVIKTHIVNYSKLLEDEQRGEIPFNFQSFAVGKNKYLRLGVPKQDSALWCLEIARKGEREKVDEKDIEKVREKLLDEEVVLEATQNAYSSEQYLRLLAEDEIDAVKFRRMLESYFGVCILILEINTSDKYGTFSNEDDVTFIPPTRFQYDKVVVLVKITKFKQDEYKTQYNLVTKGKISKFGKDDPFVKGLIGAYELSTKMNVVDVSG